MRLELGRLALQAAGFVDRFRSRTDMKHVYRSQIKKHLETAAEDMGSGPQPLVNSWGIVKICHFGMLSHYVPLEVDKVDELAALPR